MKKYEIPIEDELTDDERQTLLVGFCAKPKLTNRVIDSHDFSGVVVAGGATGGFIGPEPRGYVVWYGCVSG